MDSTGRAAGLVVRAGGRYQGKQGLDYTPGISAESVGAHASWLGSATIPLFLVSGDEVELYSGDDLEQREIARSGDYLYIPAGVPHVAVNRGSAPAAFVGARTDPNEQESVVMRPELDSRSRSRSVGYFTGSGTATGAPPRRREQADQRPSLRLVSACPCHCR